MNVAKKDWWKPLVKKIPISQTECCDCYWKEINYGGRTYKVFVCDCS